MKRDKDVSNLSLGIIGGRVSYKNGDLYALNSFAKVVEALAKKYKHIYLSSRLRETHDIEDDYPLPKNITLVEQPNWLTTLDSLKYTRKIRTSYHETIRLSDHIFVRGNPVASTKALYQYCVEYRKPVCHWLVGNPYVLLGSHKRGSLFSTLAGKTYVRAWERRLVNGRRKANGSFVCNGSELAQRYLSPKTFTTVSTSLGAADFSERADTCHGDTITILTLCYMRPEKGIEHLINAFAILKERRKDLGNLKLRLAGGRDAYPLYQAKLDDLVERFELTANIEWRGHVEHKDINMLMREADIFVLPSLSEGTPRVLLEAQANCLPVIASDVGGVPTSISSGKNGILVKPKDPESIYLALNELLSDSEKRQALIRNGYRSARTRTVDVFCDFVIDKITDEGESSAK